MDNPFCNRGKLKMEKLLIGITGSFGIMAMPAYLLELRQQYDQLKIIMTQSATQFISMEAFRMFTDGIYSSEFPLSKDNMMHIELARWADHFIVLPATAHMLAQVAHGMADTLLSATILSYENPMIFFPNMNSAMWKNKAVQNNVKLIREYGHKVINPIEQPAFEYASGKLEMNHTLPSIESVLSILKMKKELQ